MTVFIYEYICGGGLVGRPLPESLAREGWAMLASIVEDFARVEGCEVVATLDERFADRPLAARWIEWIAAERKSSSVEAERRAIERLAAECDWTLIIAPEFERILFDRVRWVEEAGGRLLGPSSSAVAIAADKYSCGQLLERSGIPAVVGRLLNLTDGIPGDADYPAVLKPRDGAGSQCTFLIRDAGEVSQVLKSAVTEGLCYDALLQPFVPGMAASVSFFVGPACAVPLLAGEQLLSDDGRFHYAGGRMPLPPEFARHAVTLGSRAVAAVPGLRGFVGVDLVLAGANGELQIANCKLQIANRSESQTDAHHSPLTRHHSPRGIAIEINPRLTTSYVGLRRLARSNLAEQMVRVAAGEEIGPIEWQSGTVRFSADGRVAYSGSDPGNSQR